MDKHVILKFEHRTDKDNQYQSVTIRELIYGVGETKQPIKEIISAYEEDGYILIDVIM